MSSNQLTSERSMNGIINVYSEDIQVNTLKANEVITNEITIVDEMTVNNTTILPSELAQLDGINTNETIQTQIDNITGDINNNYVDLTSTQTITGTKTFSNTTTLTGNLNVNSTDITPLELSYLDGATSNLQDQINNSVVGMTLDTDQVATGFKDFVNGIQAPFINNQETTGSINGYFTDSSNFIYTTKTGVFNVGTSIISGIDCVNQVLTALSTSPNTGSISPATTTRKGEVFTCEYYITDTNIITVNTNSNQIQVDQGIQFDTVSDFVSVINGYELTMLNSTTLTPTPATTLSSYILSGNLITDSNVNGQHFIEGNGLTKPVQINDSLTLEYTLTTPNSVTDTPVTSTTTGFNYNNSNWTFLDYSAIIANQDYVTGTNITLGTRLQNLSADKYDYNLTVINDTPYYTDQGFYYSNRVWLYTGSNTISVDDGIFDITHDEYAYVSIVQNDNVYTVGKTDFNVQAATSALAYINSNLQLVSLVDYTGKFTSENSITSIDSADIVPDVYNISSPNTITATNPQIVQYAYKYDANTLILENNNGIIGPFLFELPTLPLGSNQLGSYSATFDKVNTVINSDYASPATTGSSAVIFTINSDQLIYFGNSTSSGISKFIVNANLAPYTSVAFTSTLPFALRFSYNGEKITGKNSALTDTTPIINNERVIVVSVGGANKFIFGTTTQVNLNDITKGLTAQIGRYITSKTQSVSTFISGLYEYTLNYTQSPSIAQSGPFNWTQAKNSSQIVVSYNFLFPNAFAVGDFINYDGGVWGFITSLAGSSPSAGWLIEAGTFSFGNISGSGSGSGIYNFGNGSGVMSVYRPQSIDIYDAIRCDVYEIPIDIYDKVDYGFFNKTINNIYTPVSYNQYQRGNAYFYSNNVYNAQTSTQIDLPAVALADTFVVEDFAQDLSNKTFTDNTTFEQGLTAIGTITTQYLTASRDISCRDLDATRDVNSVDFNGTGLLTMSDNTLEHPISNVYIGRQFNTTSNNYGLSVGASQTDLNNYVITRNVSNDFTVINAPTGGEVWTTINNTMRFLVKNSETLLYNSASNDGSRVFANSTNVWQDYFTQGKSYDVRFNMKRRNANNGEGWFDTYAYRGRFWFGGTKMMEWGYINANNSFLMGRAPSTWIQFNTNTEIYYQINGANRMTAASNGYHYATLHVNTSDERLKSNIIDVSNALQTINTIEVKEFDKKCSMCCDDDDCTEEISHEIGFIAQQVEETDMSFCVTTTQLNDTKGLKDSCIFSLNVKATQELYALVMKQQEEINLLKEKLSFLNV